MIASKTIDCIICAFERPRYNLKKKSRSLCGKNFCQKKNSLGGKSVHGKKSLRFGMVSDVDQKITKSFGGKKISLEAIDFLPLKVLCIFCFAPDAVQIRRTFSSLSNPPYANFFKRDSLYLDLLPGPFKSAIIFYHF